MERTVDDMLFCILSHFTHQFDWLLLVSSSVCGLVDCPCEIDVESESESESAFDFDDEEVADGLKKFAQTLGAFLYTSEVAGFCFTYLLNNPRLPISVLEWATSAYRGVLDSRLTVDGFSPILRSIANENWNVVKAFTKYGADLHYVGKDIDYSPVEETATTLSLYSSRRFFEWRDILRDREIDIAGFINDELQHSRLR